MISNHSSMQSYSLDTQKHLLSTTVSKLCSQLPDTAVNTQARPCPPEGALLNMKGPKENKKAKEPDDF